MTRAPWVVPKPARAFPAGDGELVSTTLGWRLVNPAMPAEHTVSSARAPRSWPSFTGSAASARTSSPSAATGSPTRRERGTFAVEAVPCQAPSWNGTRASGLARPSRSWRRCARRSVQTAGRSPPATPRSSATGLPPCSSATRAPPTRPAWRRWRGSPHGRAVEPRLYGIGPVQAAELACGGRDRLGRPGRRRAERGVRRPGPRPHRPVAQARPGQGQPERRRRRARPPDRVLGRPYPRHPGRWLRRRGGGWSLAAICIGVGQGLAVVLEG